ncbi:hypothetical protein FOXB_02095 [Fusarium oxysporum f. sp. conglutinans Fo5176]|uniref:CENP-V/GFA domain-containing protein n=1 Tax=Fusarium oxysporum (strain Fo5176) TaxID=660025 RepID=F9F6S0_FUSOF|nr:hypothetical protein FOXB_02095 [Fusarium oxysporum f. sp. conglutinans Fo5176]
MATEQSHKAEKFFPRAGLAQDGWSTKEEATATCYCGAVQLVLPITKPGFVFSFVCHCSDCRKITASMFTTGIVVLDTYLKHIRGEENLKQFSQSDTIERDGSAMTNFFCSTCGSLMYRRSSAYAGLYKSKKLKNNKNELEPFLLFSINKLIIIYYLLAYRKYKYKLLRIIKKLGFKLINK